MKKKILRIGLDFGSTRELIPENGKSLIVKGYDNYLVIEDEKHDK